MQRLNHAEMPPVARENLADTKAFRDRYHCRIDKTKRQISVVMK
jgi:hypothetical protein